MNTSLKIGEKQPLSRASQSSLYLTRDSWHSEVLPTFWGI